MPTGARRRRRSETRHQDRSGLWAACSSLCSLPDAERLRAGTVQHTVQGCAAYGVHAIEHHITVTWKPAPCQGLSKAEVNQAVAMAVVRAAGDAPKAIRRRREGEAAPYLDHLVSTLPPVASSLPTGARSSATRPRPGPSDGPCRADRLARRRWQRRLRARPLDRPRRHAAAPSSRRRHWLAAGAALRAFRAGALRAGALGGIPGYGLGGAGLGGGRRASSRRRAWHGHAGHRPARRVVPPRLRTTAASGTRSVAPPRAMRAASS